MSTPHPPTGPDDPTSPGDDPAPGARGTPPLEQPGRRPPAGALVAIGAAAALAAVGIGVAVARSGADDAGPTTRPSVTASRATTMPSSIPSSTTAGTEGPSSTTSAPPATTTTTSEPPPPDVETLPVPEVPAGAVELGSGVYVPLPLGWAQVSGDDSPFTITDGSTWYAARVVQQSPGTGPEDLLQLVVDEFDSTYTSVSYTPVNYGGSVTGTLPADEYRVTYSAITPDGGRMAGIVQAFVRGDGLAVAVRAWSATDTWPSTDEATDAITDTVKRSLTDAPPVGEALTLPVTGPFRVASIHPVVTSEGLAGFTVPPGFEAWPRTTTDGITLAGAQNGATDLVAIAMPAPPTVEEVFATVVADLDERYPGLVVDAPSPQGTRDGVSRLGAGFAGTLGGRPIAGGLDVWLVAGDTAYAFTYTYYADIELDGSNPDPVATQFAYSAYANSF